MLKCRVVATLINAGADICARNYFLWTPIDCAAAYGQPKCVKQLIEVRNTFSVPGF
jgi:ankyrin repeat protein